ncbi:MAG: GNAT family N-acetyltransferase [Saprospiraceae bacterium]|nr:GNAT family N-acetyltransferase [Saprospiraceae bacterium]
MTHLLRSDAHHPDFIDLVNMLDADLALRDGDEHAFYAPLNSSDHLRHVIVAYQHNLPIACGAIRPFDDSSVEIKRMFTLSDHRGKGIASQVLTKLEKWAGELAYSRCILETGHKQPEAIALYTRHGYSIIANYGPYEDVENSVCFEKILTRS